jgi:disulfide bond formation protein DsbB
MIRDEQISTLMGAGASALLLGALGLQYFAHLAPCEMCHWQRWPYIAAAVIGLGSLLWKGDRRLLTVPVILVVAILGVIVARQWQNTIPVALAAIALAGFAATQTCARGMALLTILLVASSGLVGLYQTGMQLGILPGPSACTVAHAYVIGSGAPEPEVSCNVVTWSLFGLSLAAYNAIFAFLIAGTGAFLLSRKHATPNAA